MARRSLVPCPPQPIRPTRTRRFAPATWSCEAADTTGRAADGTMAAPATPAAAFCRNDRRDGLVMLTSVIDACSARRRTREFTAGPRQTVRRGAGPYNAV